MTDRQREETRAYSVSVTFRSGGEPYAVQAYRIDAVDAFDAERLARDEARTSVYYDARIPDLDLVVDLTPVEPEDDPPPPATSSAGAGRSRRVS